MKRYWLPMVPTIAALVLGCATPGGQQRDDTLYDLHARTVRLEKNLGTSIEQLNTTSAELTAQVSASDRNMEQLRSLLDENQRKLEQLERSFATLEQTMYKEMGYTGPPNPVLPGASTSPRDVVIEPPATPVNTLPVAETQPPFESTGPVAPGGPPVVASVDENAAMRAYNQVQEAYKAERYAEALEGFNQFLLDYPQSSKAVNALFFKGSSQQRLGQYIESIESYQTLKSQYPTSEWVPIAIYNQAVAHAKLGELDVAKSILSNLIVQYPATPAAEQAKIELEKLQQY